jgi:hypothetical protein
VVTCINRSPFSCPVIGNVIWIEPHLRGHLSYKATFSLFQMWPLNTGLTMHDFMYRDYSKSSDNVLLSSFVFLYKIYSKIRFFLFRGKGGGGHKIFSKNIENLNFSNLTKTSL